MPVARCESVGSMREAGGLAGVGEGGEGGHSLPTKFNRSELHNVVSFNKIQFSFNKIQLSPNKIQDLQRYSIL